MQRILPGYFKDGQALSYELERGRRRNLYLCVGEQGVVARAPQRMRAETIEAFLLQKRSWVEKQLAQSARQQRVRRLAEGDGEFVRRAARIIAGSYERMSALTGITAAQVHPKRLKSSWGRCRADGKISINIAVALFPQEIVDYVMLHELCHLRHMNHSPQFWALVEGHMPDYRARRKILKQCLL